MSTQMSDFLIKLSSDPLLAEKFKDDPSSVMTDFNLTREEASVLTRRDPYEIDRVLRVEDPSGNKENGKKKKKAKKKKGKEKKAKKKKNTR